MMRNHLLHEHCDHVREIGRGLGLHLHMHLAGDRLHALFEIRIQGATQETLGACTCATPAERFDIESAACGIDPAAHGWRIQPHGRRVGHWRAVRLGDRRPISILDDDPAAHLGVDVAEVVDLSTERRIGHLLGDRELGRVLLRHPLRPWVEEHWLVAVKACVPGIWAGCGRPVDLVQQLACCLNFGSLWATPIIPMRAIRVEGEAQRVVPIGTVALVKCVGLPDLHRDVWRGPGETGELEVARLTNKKIHLDAEMSVRRGTIGDGSGDRGDGASGRDRYVGVQG
mmetsp:Transcript_38634/g.110915  ORF Transcript_38634/g.110915 Transcript_38634/m.110915 type:complete len:285 (+) Transcript_38634:441-1295(+)